MTPASIRQRIAELEAIKSAPDVSDTAFAEAVGEILELRARLAQVEKDAA